LNLKELFSLDVHTEKLKLHLNELNMKIEN